MAGASGDEEEELGSPPGKKAIFNKFDTEQLNENVLYTQVCTFDLDEILFYVAKLHIYECHTFPRSIFLLKDETV
jgi:hypothetical protein